MKILTKWLYRIISVSVIVVCAVNPLLHMTIDVLVTKGMIPASWSAFDHPFIAFVFVILFMVINIFPSVSNRGPAGKRIRICADGTELLVLFMISITFTVISFCFWIASYKDLWEAQDRTGVITSIGGSVITAVIILAVVFWNGIIRIYSSSVQLGIRYRVWGLILGWLFPANLIMLGKMIRVVSGEVRMENEKAALNITRHDETICATRYPLLLVHGVFFRDFKQGFMNYWGRIPNELTSNGAVIYYGDQQSAASVAECGNELADRIRQIVNETGCEKVNIIGHSKGGLDSRYAISKCGVSDMVASLTTINTPHRGCEFADYLLEKIPEPVKMRIASAYNSALFRLGDHDPDFMEAVTDLTHSACAHFNEEVPDAEGVFYQSYGSHMKKAGGGRFPLNYSFHLVKLFDGPNDGLVGEKSFEWGSSYRYLEPAGDRGISHGDMIDLNRENIEGFDVREFYVQLVADLKKRGL